MNLQQGQMNLQQGHTYYRSSKMQALQDRFVHPPVDYEQELLEAVRMGDEATALQVMRKINELEAAVLATYPLRSKKKRPHRLLHFVYKGDYPGRGRSGDCFSLK